MQQKKPDVDVILDVLKGCIERYPDSTFVNSLHQQYMDRGFLTKKQLEGLHSKAQKALNIPPHKLATLEAIIKKMPTRFKSEAPANPSPVYEKNIPVRIFIAAILEKQPGHKRVLELKAKYDTNTPLSRNELTELQRFYKMFLAPG
ncbi:MAG TPA: hypothetical protein VK907_08685 [Phnomibacter sp.]|nr:hypothetical protein [Phnomibacter sp.]